MSGPARPLSSPAVAAPANSPILSIFHGETGPFDRFAAHAHPEPILMSSSSATLTVLSRSRDAGRAMLSTSVSALSSRALLRCRDAHLARCASAHTSP